MISIIVPIYNVKPYLSKCIESILNQTYADLEIILVDDGSTDGSGDLCDEYLSKDKRIKVIHKQNGGLSSARNAGLDIATGDYIGFVDSDDYISTDMYERLLLALEQESADMSICCFEYVNEQGQAIESVAKQFDKKCVISRVEAFQKITTFDKYYIHYATAVNKLYKRKVFDGLRFEEGRINEDEFIAHLVYAKCDKIALMPDKLYFYFQRNGSIMNSSYTVKKLDGVWAFYYRYKFLKKNGFKKLAKRPLIASYGFLLSGINKLSYRKNKKQILSIAKKLVFNFDLGLRAVKLFLIIAKKHLRSVASVVVNKRRIKKAFSKTNRKKPRAVILATPVHGNLGDQAIVYAEKNFLKQLGYEKSQIIEIKNNIYLGYSDLLPKFIKREDLIVIDGGGNLGMLWPHEDDKISRIISEYKDNKIIVFPQTIYYDTTHQSLERIKKNRSIYESAKYLTIAFRDETSYKFAQKNFPETRLVYSPDIVLSINDLNYGIDRNGVFLCFREDLEKVVSNEEVKKIEEYLTKNEIGTKKISTVLDKYVSFENRNEELNDKWKEFSSARLIITDRLHAMIFSAITATPCIAIDNVSKKVSGSYEWLKSLPYIKCVENLEQACDLILDFYHMEKCQYVFLEETFEELKKGICY